MESQFELKDTVQFYCPDPSCKKAITYRHLEECFSNEPKEWEEGKFRCPHCSAVLARKVIRRFETGGYQWIPEYVGKPRSGQG
jgi:hypothetical protein